MKNFFGRTILLVEDYEEAFAFYNKVLGFTKLFDGTADNGLRFLHVGFGAEDPVGIWFFKANNEAQRSRVGRQTADAPFMVIYTDSLEEIYENLKELGVKITKAPVDEAEFKYLHFLDLYGNEIVLVELSR